jgi:hypothetical protein
MTNGAEASWHSDDDAGEVGGRDILTVVRCRPGRNFAALSSSYEIIKMRPY